MPKFEPARWSSLRSQKLIKHELINSKFEKVDSNNYILALKVISCNLLN